MLHLSINLYPQVFMRGEKYFEFVKYSNELSLDEKNVKFNVVLLESKIPLPKVLRELFGLARYKVANIIIIFQGLNGKLKCFLLIVQRLFCRNGNQIMILHKK